MLKQVPVAILLFIPSLLRAQTDTQQAAFAAYERKDYPTCAAIFERLGDKTYAAACYARAGNKEKAFALLDEAVKSGFPNTTFLKDEDFASLHDNAHWQTIVAGTQANWEKKFGNDNRELWAISDADRADRSGDIPDLNAAIERDHQRLARTKEIVAAGGLKTAQDYFNAAVIFQHGAKPEDYQKAHELAIEAYARDIKNTRAKWLIAASEDRFLRSIGKPQIFGTQFKKNDQGIWELEPIDESVMTDAQRAAWGVPSLAEQRKRAEEMNK